jgi:hypothetical protein
MKYLILGVVGVAVVAGAALPPWVEPLVSELEWVEEALLEATYFCALAVMAPARVDQQVLAQRVVNILEGSDGPHFDPRVAEEENLPGVIPRLQALVETLHPEEVPPNELEVLRFHLGNAGVFLLMAREAALRGGAGRQLRWGAVHLRQAYAFLLAALGPEEEELAYLGGIRPLLSRYRPLLETGEGP